MIRDAVTIGQSDRREIVAKFDNEVFDARFDQRDVPSLPAVGRSGSPREKLGRPRTGPIKAVGIQFHGKFNAIDRPPSSPSWACTLTRILISAIAA
jgi:hypothetical protein